MNTINSSLKKTPVAIIGLSAMFADASNVEQFWNNIIDQKDSIIDVPESRWKIEDYYNPDPRMEDKTYCKKGGFIPDVDFNPMEFGLPPNILEVTDASQLLALIAARDAFEDAGYGRESDKFTALLKEKTGVILGVGGGQKLITPLTSRLQTPIWEKALKSSGISDADIPHIVEKMKKAYIGWNENSFPGMLGNVISGRITNRFDLGGINSVVDAACAASLSAIKMAVSELIEGRCDMMLTGGVDTDNSPFMYMSFSKTPAFSQKGSIRPFDTDSDGMLIGEGIGMLVLKRLEDAERDGDRIYGLLTGVGSSSDGRYKSVYAPRPHGQALAMQRAYDEAGYDASTVKLIEGHGTATGAGDAAEFESMSMVFGKNDPTLNHIAIGSIKSQIGHTKSAAGAAGMIKSALALYHKVLPGTINVTKPHEKFGIEKSPFYVNAATRPWFRNGVPRRAGVSAFGFGGVNVHFAMEEYEKSTSFTDRMHQAFHNIYIKDTDANSLLSNLKNTIAALHSEEVNTIFYNLKETSKQGTAKQHEVRVGFVAESLVDCISKLEIALKQLENNKEAWSHPKGIFYRPNGISSTMKVASLFSGQGSQYANMAKEATSSFETIQHTIAAFDSKKGYDLANKIYPKPVFTAEDQALLEKNITNTEFAQPAIGAISLGYYKVFKNAGFVSDMVAGHSFGELTALCASGILSEDDYMTLAIARGKAMAGKNANGDAGTMLAVKAAASEIQPLIATIAGVSIANINSSNQIVVAGTTEGVMTAKALLDTKKYRSILLPVSAAFHTECVGHAQQPFEKSIKEVQFSSPLIPVYSNSTGTIYPIETREIKNILAQHILNPVDFKAEIENMYAAGARVFVEFGPKPILTNLVKNILTGKEHFVVATNAKATKNSDLQIREAAIQLQVLGCELGAIDSNARQEAIPLGQPKMAVKIAGNNYVSPATQKAYKDVLNNGFKVSGATEIIKTVEVVKEVVKEVPSALSEIKTDKDTEEDMMVDVIKSAIEGIKENQSKTLDMFQTILTEQNKQTAQLLNLLSGKVTAEQPLLKTPTVPVVSIKTPTPAAAVVETSVAPTPVQPSTPVATPIAQTVVSAEPALGNSEMLDLMLSVVADKTGYPAEMLELSMDMEADLGIDSIKRVEIFGAITEQSDKLTDINPNDLTELRTLQEIVDYISSKAGIATTATPPTSVVADVVATPVATPVVETSTVIEGNSEMLDLMLSVVADKTGYPAEMLELSMDMEADLGIDSIKRVEIFGAITEQSNKLTDINPNDLTELRTLQEIVDYISSKAGIATTATPPTSVVASPEATPVATPVAETSTLTEGNSEMLDLMLSVVADKTGYPAEMLELSMDMEADLGIDSIKRVEIFGAITEQSDKLTDINPNDLTELRTLQEIVDYISSKAGISATATPTAPSAASLATTPVATPAVEVISNDLFSIPVVETVVTSEENSEMLELMLSVVADKTGYPAEMLELSMDMEADLGIDSIKRVEIFGAITEQSDKLTDINPNDLTELRTLQEIVDYISSKAGISTKKKSLSLA